MMTTAQAAARLGVAVRTIQAWIKSGRLPARKMGRDWFIAEADLETFSPPPQGRPPQGTPEQETRT